MAVPFQNIPSGDTWRLPLFYAEVDPSQANTATQTQRTLIIAQATSVGTGQLNVPNLCGSQAIADRRAGPDSMAARMYLKYRLNDPTGEVWLLLLADNGAGAAAIGTFTVTAAPTANGTLNLYVGGRRVQVAITAAMTTTQAATAIAAAVNADPRMAANATSSAAIVTLTAVHKGLNGNDIDIETNYYGDQGGEFDPAGLTYTIVAMSGGTSNPDLTTALANCADTPFDFVVFAYDDTTSLNSIQGFLNDTTGRWSFNRQVYGHALTVSRGTLGALTTLGTGRNDPHTTIVGYKNSPTPPEEWAACYYGACAVSLRIDPGVPLQFLSLQGVLAPNQASIFADVDRNTLLHDGISTFIVQPDGTVQTENVISTYQLNSAGQPDNSLLEVEDLFLLIFIIRDTKSLITTKYARKKLGADGTRFAPGSNVVTPGIIRLDVIAQYRLRAYQGYVQQPDVFAANLVVQINPTNPNRIDMLWPGTLIGQLRQFAMLAQFRLQPQ